MACQEVARVGSWRGLHTKQMVPTIISATGPSKAAKGREDVERTTTTEGSCREGWQMSPDLARAKCNPCNAFDPCGCAPTDQPTANSVRAYSRPVPTLRVLLLAYITSKGIIHTH
jgi:hypothetical protein